MVAELAPAGARKFFCFAVGLPVILATLLAAPADATAQGLDHPLVPPESYFSSFGQFHEGEYGRALKEFESEGRSAIKTATSRWIDSICFHAMAGECHYHMGHLPEALEHYTSAIELYVAFSDWMIPVQFQPIRPANVGQIHKITWGASGRGTVIGEFPRKTLIGQGRLNNAQQVQQGGVVQNPIMYPLNVQEIVRCTTLAIRRRRDLLGPVSPHDDLTRQLIAALERRPAPRGHWSQAWIDVQLGLAYTAAGRDAEAQRLLESSLTAAGQFDHPMTCVALLELGRLAMKQGNFPAASTALAEAGFSAAQFLDLGVLEESFRYGQMAHLMSGQQGIYPPLGSAIGWARLNRFRQLQASLLTLAAENHAVVGLTADALRLLDEARGVIGRRDMGRGSIGARASFAQSLALYAEGRVPAGNQMLASALDYQRAGSHWLFHIGRVDLLASDGQLRDRVAMDLYEEVLRDPTAADWNTDPLESLSVLVHPHLASYENWFLTALARNAPERALEIADLARRHRFYSTLEMGGRLLSLRWMLEGPREMLSQQAALHRQGLLVAFPSYGPIADEAARLRGQLERMPLVPEDVDTLRGQRALLEQLAHTSVTQEVALRAIAVRRQPCEMVFPPRRTTKELQEGLREGQALLCFFAVKHEMYGFLMTRDKYGLWPVPRMENVKRQLALLLRKMGNFDQNRELTVDELRDEEWTEAAAQLSATLLSGSKAENVLAQIDELIIVPDGILWYVPFETLPLGDNDTTQRLIARASVRYSPTAGLAVGDPRPRGRVGRAMVSLGKLYPRDDDQVAVEAFNRWAGALPGAVAISGTLPASSDLYGTLIDSLIVLSDIPRGGAYDWAPLAIDRGAAGSTLESWFELPWGGPEVALLPGFHSPAEDGLKGPPAAASGDDLFLATCGLMSTGARTVLISRWRTGGQISFDLMRELAQELPHAAAADAWRRSVLLASDTHVDPELEPRVKNVLLDEPVTAGHPFFWSGYMLIDSGVSPVAGPAPGQAAAN